MKIISGLLKIAATVVIVVFSILNTAPVEVSYFFTKPPVHLPLFIVVLAAMLFGVLLSGMLYSMDRFSLKRNISGLKKQIKKNEDEMTRLRNIPFEEPKDIAKGKDL